MVSLDQSPYFKIEPTGIPEAATLDAAAPLTEWALKTSMSIPAFPMYDLIHLPMEFLFIGLKGLIVGMYCKRRRKRLPDGSTLWNLDLS